MIYRIINVFDNKRRKQILEQSKIFMEDSEAFEDGKFFPGRQTRNNLHHRIPFAASFERRIGKFTGLNLAVINSWANWTNGNKRDIAWHSHPYPYTGVYYLKTFPFFSNGTLFREKFVKAPQNSLLLFPGHMEHTAPSSPLRVDRYTLAMEFEIR